MELVRNSTVVSSVCLTMAMADRIERLTYSSFRLFCFAIIGQCLLHLANYYAISSSSSSTSLGDCIALFYILSSPSPELKVAYRPSNSGGFSLHDFHHAVKGLPVDAFFPDPTYTCDTKLSCLLQDQLLSWWSDDSDAIATKVVVLTSSLPPAVDADLHKSLLDAADKCISIEFVFFETRSNHLYDMLEINNAFSESISHLDNCSLRTCLPEARILDGMVKIWLRDLKDETEEQIPVCFIFKNNLLGSVNQILCNLSIHVAPILDGFSPWHDLGCIDVVESSVKIGEKMSLFLPDSSKLINCQKVSTPIDFNVTERTNLGSLSEGVMVGAPHVVTPAAGHEIGETSDEMNELNAQLFQGVCRVLHSLDQGLVCYSKYNVEAKRSALFPCYYILQPSENGPMLLRRVAGLEETLPVLNMEKYFGSTVTKEIESSVQASILMVESIDYDPFLHPRGFHKNLNLLVEESIQFRPAPPPEEKVLTSDLNTSNANTIRSMDFVVDLTRGGEELEEEWEQLVVNEVPSVAAQAHAPTPATANQRGSKEAAASAADDKTWRILERLEAPGSNRFIHKNIDATATSNKLIRPNFQRLKRKLR
ncbi:hypothetical protein CDL15_Pgr003456 [Punica granatum]|uniref:Uncharacterized protein n=1 Tax=Punica granatum TaxID=22663 RepID=A0A218X303_PUNGR|nr:hypothetical protein CDL15_Pgr003456 [Punica granatum]